MTLVDRARWLIARVRLEWTLLQVLRHMKRAQRELHDLEKRK